MNNEEAYKRIENIVFKYEEKELSSLEDRKLNNEALNHIREALNERPHGEWVVQRLQNGFDDVYCPFCIARPTRSQYGYYLKDNFCHECGADMRKGGAE